LRTSFFGFVQSIRVARVPNVWTNDCTPYFIGDPFQALKSECQDRARSEIIEIE